ncbi:MAG: DUF2169 domain-containing protein [Nannocystaceae bacterium]|nr:DUF2169 domain-containing protein [Nannocystaceae bacterium]
MSRTAVHDDYDATVGLWPRGTVAQLAYGLCKITVDLASGRRVQAEPLRHDVWDPRTVARLAPGSDHWFDKPATDVFVVGDAIAPHAVPELAVGVRVGTRELGLRVIGRRVATRRDDRIAFSEPEPFERMPLSWAHAYGGCDPRVDVSVGPAAHAALGAGTYARNPEGKGYVVLPIERELELPNLEAPEQPLTPANLVVGDPRRWFAQPLPRCFAPVPAIAFPRSLWFGLDAWHRAPDDARLPEVALGMLPAGFRNTTLPPARARQEAAPGLVFDALAPGTPIVVAGMDPQGRSIALTVPPAPTLALELEGQVQRPSPRLTTVALRPNEGRATFTWAITTTELPRGFVVGVHRAIPLALQVDGGTKVAWRPTSDQGAPSP